MAYLDIDTDELRSLVTTAQRANDSISEAVELLNQITVHDDWICPQRDTINNFTLANRQTATSIQDNSSAFYEAIKSVSDQFDQAEQDSISRQSAVDEWFGSIASVVGSEITPASPVISSFSDFSDSTSTSEG